MHAFMRHDFNHTLGLSQITSDVWGNVASLGILQMVQNPTHVALAIYGLGGLNATGVHCLHLGGTIGLEVDVMNIGELVAINVARFP